MDKKLLRKNQIDKITIKVSRGIGMLKRMKTYAHEEILKTVYNPLIMPYFDYCSLVQDNCGKYLLEKLQKLKNTTARVLTGKFNKI